MTTIRMDSSSITNNAMSNSGSGGGGSQIAVITKQITQLTQRLKDLGSDSTIDSKDKKVMQELIQGQIQMLEAQIARIQQQQSQHAADKQKQDIKSESITKVTKGINPTSDGNAVDLYV